MTDSQQSTQLSLPSDPNDPQIVQQRAREIAGGEIDPEAVERLQAQEAAARAAGFAPKPPVFALGTRVVDVGAANFRRSRAEFERLPPAREALARLIDRVVCERRVDSDARVRDLIMEEDGTISRGGSPLALTETSFRQLLARTACPEPGAAAIYLATVPPARRAAEVNAWIKETDAEKVAVVRHRKNMALSGNGRQAYAIVSERYSALDTDQLARIMLEQEVAPGDARCEVQYDGDRVELALRWHSDIQPETCAAGEIFRAAAGLRSADDGTQSIEPFAGLDRNLCLNLIILDHAEVRLGKKRHVGNNIAGFMFENLKLATDRVRYFAELWGGAARTRLTAPGIVRDVPDGATTDELVRGCFRGLLTAGKLVLPGYRREPAIEILMAAFTKEPEPTKVGLVNAVTRAAHEADLRGAWATQQVQEAGGALLASKRPLQWLAAGEDF